MTAITVQNGLFLRLDDAAHDIGFATPGKFVDFVLTETLDVGGFDDLAVYDDVFASDGTGTNGLEISDSLYEKLENAIEGTDYESIESAVRAALIAYSQQSDVVALDVSTARLDGHEAAIRENLQDLGYID
jgi:hypothetical protein